MKKSYQVLKWTAEVREKELQCLEEVELLDNHDPPVEFESDSESEAYDFLEKESGFTYVVADRERCYKYHPVVSDVVPKRSACRQGDLAKV